MAIPISQLGLHHFSHWKCKSSTNFQGLSFKERTLDNPLDPWSLLECDYNSAVLMYDFLCWAIPHVLFWWYMQLQCQTEAPDHGHDCHQSRRCPCRRGSCPWRHEWLIYVLHDKNEALHIVLTLLGTNISPSKVTFKSMIFPISLWVGYVIVPRRVYFYWNKQKGAMN